MQFCEIFVVATLIKVIVLTNATPVTRVKNFPIEQVVFQLYTRQTFPNGQRVLFGNESTLEGTGFDPNLPTKFIVHGWMDDLESGTIQAKKIEFLNLEPMNVFGVGWSECSHVVLYEQSVECAKQVGTYIGNMVVWLGEITGLSPANVHCLGHSLGGQAVSFVSRVLRVGQITALDPAAPLFTHQGPSSRLDENDADFVDVMHSSTTLLGERNAVGHVDFYPNGGIHQPGCDDFFGSCAHSSSNHYYVFTITEEHRNDYLAYQCLSAEQARNETCNGEPRAVMGYGVDHNTRGVYYLTIPMIPQ